MPRGWLALVMAGVLGCAVTARAETLTAGGLLAGAGAGLDDGIADELSLERFAASREGAVSVSLPFTPRNPMSLLFGSADGAAAEPGEMQLSVSRSQAQAERMAALQSGPSAAGPDEPRTLEIGGALHWSDWVVGSAYTRAPLFGGNADLLSATLGYGRVQARLAYGQTEAGTTDGLDVLMLSTDLAAWPWLTLESDLAVGAGETGTVDSRAVGRLGIRLNF